MATKADLVERFERLEADLDTVIDLLADVVWRPSPRTSRLRLIRGGVRRQFEGLGKETH